jgi:hypothetical protein
VSACRIAAGTLAPTNSKIHLIKIVAESHSADSEGVRCPCPPIPVQHVVLLGGVGVRFGDPTRH